MNDSHQTELPEGDNAHGADVLKHHDINQARNEGPAEHAGAMIDVKSPFLKWAGRKTKILGTIIPLLPRGDRRYLEPFLGSGAVFLNTEYPRNLLSDSNADLIDLFKAVADGGEGFIAKCQELFTPQNNQGEKFYEFREEFNACSDVVRKSALFLCN
jgi:DNA adenine methylase Dam